MKRAWLGLALLSASWLFGLSYYQAAQTPTLESWHAWRAAWHDVHSHSLPAVGAQFGWLARMFASPGLIVLGALLMGGVPVSLPSRGLCAVVALFVLPACFWLPLPYHAAAWAMLAGALFGALLGSKRPYLARAGLLGGATLLLQALVMTGYAAATGRSHDLPGPLPEFLACVAKLLTLDAAACGAHVAMHTMRQVYMLGATWDLFLDPATVCMLVGGAAMLTAAVRGAKESAGTQWWLRSLVVWVVVVVLWLPVRTGLLMAVFIQRALLLDYDAPINQMNQFWTPWMYLLMLAGPVCLAWRFVSCGPPKEQAVAPAPASGKFFLGAACGLAALATVCFVLAVLWNPVGARKAGRVLVDEFHSEWERTDTPMDTEWYGHMSGYNYACIYDYLARFYGMQRQMSPTTEALLADYDVLVLKTPTKPFAPSEIEAVVQFVNRGGGLLLVGEHTTVFGTGTYLNQVAHRFGFAYRPDCVFSITGSPFEQAYYPPKVPHPVVEHLPPPRGETAPMNFAVSCSIDPQRCRGQAVILSTGLKNLFADYHASNFYPQVTDLAEARYGAFVQLWATQLGGGHVLAFTDSTIFSNFSTFEPGKAELMLGMIEWLNHRAVPSYFRLLLTLIGAVATVICLLLAWNCRGSGFVIVATAVLSIVLTGIVIHQQQLRRMPLPSLRKDAAPLTRVIVDRTLCDGPLSNAGFILGEADGFGIFERWILRLGYFIKRTSGHEVTRDNMVVFLYPHKKVPPHFRQQIADYVAGGGKVLVVDAPENTESKSAELLEPFGLSLAPGAKLSGELSPPQGWPTGIIASSALGVVGGEPLIKINGTPVAATVRHGEGSVTLLGFGQRFTDPQMGLTGDVEPNPEQRNLFNLEFTLFRWLIDGVLWAPPATPSSAPATTLDISAH